MTDQTPTHDEAFEMMAAYIDGTLPPTDVARLEPHIAECAVCTALLHDEEDRVDLGTTTATQFDDSVLRGSIRHTLLRTAGYASVLVVLLVVLLIVGSTLVIQPLLMNAGGRAESVARATFDLASMITEGTVVDEFRIDSGFAHRTYTAELGLPLGSAVVDAGTVTSTVTLGGTKPGDVWPFADGPEPNPVPASSLLNRLGASSVATVAARFPQPLDHADAQALADMPGADVSVIWAGFLVSAAAPNDQLSDPLRTLGFSTCSNDRIPDSLFGASSADAGGSFGEQPPSVADAYDRVRAAIQRLADDEDVRSALPLGWSDSVVAIDEHLREFVAPVETLVVTGPADEILTFLEDAGVVNAHVLAVDFFNWVGPICG